MSFLTKSKIRRLFLCKRVIFLVMLGCLFRTVSIYNEIFLESFEPESFMKLFHFYIKFLALFKEVNTQSVVNIQVFQL